MSGGFALLVPVQRAKWGAGNTLSSGWRLRCVFNIHVASTVCLTPRWCHNCTAHHCSSGPANCSDFKFHEVHGSLRTQSREIDHQGGNAKHACFV